MGPRHRRSLDELPVPDCGSLPASIESTNVMNEVTFALEEKKDLRRERFF